MNFATHPRQIQRYRDAKPPVAGLMSFRCKKCGHAIYTMEGRKKYPGGGWKCADCAKEQRPC